VEEVKAEKMKSRFLSAAWIIMLVTGIVMLLFGFIFTLVPDFMNTMGYESYTGQSWSAFLSATPKTVDFLLLTAGTMFGLHLVVMAVLFIAITVTSFRTGHKWAWYALLIASTVGWLSDAVAVYVMGVVQVAIGNLVFLSLAYIALAISAKPILSKKIAPKPDV
jgi:hypothetical protein